MSEYLPAPVDSKILIYQSDSGEARLEVRLQDETVWLTQNLMAELYGTTKQNISLHIQNIFEEGELAPEATVKKYLTVRQEGSRTVRRLLDYYNLDLIFQFKKRTLVHFAVDTDEVYMTTRLSRILHLSGDSRHHTLDEILEQTDEIGDAVQAEIQERLSRRS